MSYILFENIPPTFVDPVTPLSISINICKDYNLFCIISIVGIQSIRHRDCINRETRQWHSIHIRDAPISESVNILSNICPLNSLVYIYIYIEINYLR